MEVGVNVIRMAPTTIRNGADDGLCRQHVRDEWAHCANEAADKCPPISGKWVHWTAEDYWWERHCSATCGLCEGRRRRARTAPKAVCRLNPRSAARGEGAWGDGGAIPHSTRMKIQTTQQPCVGEDQNHGRWVALAGAESAAPCCEAGAASNPWCNTGRLPQLSSREGTCSCSGLASYSWQPSSCRLPSWDARRWCGLLGNRTVLFIGDSTMEQTYTVLQSFIAWGYRDTDGVGCACQMLFELSDTLVKVYMGHMNRGLHWEDAVEAHRPSIIVISAGAHIFSEDNYTSVLKQVSHAHRTRYAHTQLIWKTQQPGGCGRTPEPLTELPRRDDPIQAAYQYRSFRERDAHARRLFSQRVSATVLDLSPLYLRADAHPGSPGAGSSTSNDCLHFCYGRDGGPLNLVPTLLLHLLGG